MDKINEQDPTHKDITPLGIACKKGATHLIQILLDNGADKSMKTSEGHTMVDLYEMQEHTDEDIKALISE